MEKEKKEAEWPKLGLHTIFSSQEEKEIKFTSEEIQTITSPISELKQRWATVASFRRDLDKYIELSEMIDASLIMAERVLSQPEQQWIIPQVNSMNLEIQIKIRKKSEIIFQMTIAGKSIIKENRMIINYLRNQGINQELEIYEPKLQAQDITNPWEEEDLTFRDRFNLQEDYIQQLLGQYEKLWNLNQTLRKMLKKK